MIKLINLVEPEIIPSLINYIYKEENLSSIHNDKKSRVTKCFNMPNPYKDIYKEKFLNNLDNKENFYLDNNIRSYKYKENGHFIRWHRDVYKRKVDYTCLCLLQHAEEGGDLEFLEPIENSNKANVIKVKFKHPGQAIIFPYDTLHRLTPITKGIRYSFAIWAYRKTNLLNQALGH